MVLSWFGDLAGLSKAVFIIALAASIILLIQLILLIIGGIAGDTDIDVDTSIDDLDGINDTNLFEVGGMKVLTFRGVVTFFAIGGWVVLLMVESGALIWLSILVGILAGFAAMWLFAFAFKQALKLQGDGNIDYHNAIGKTGSVYLTIPKKNSGMGKVSVLVQERLIEVDAITNDDVDIKTGEKVEIVSVDDTTLIVKRKVD